MIEISELRPPKKLSGLSSLEVSFPYSPEAVEAVKRFEPAIWDKKSRA